MDAETTALQQIQQSTRGTCETEWVQHIKLCGKKALIDERGMEVKPKILLNTSRSGVIGDALEWRWVKTNVVQFRSLHSVFSLASGAVQLFYRLMRITNYPDLLRRRHGPRSLRLHHHMEAG